MRLPEEDNAREVEERSDVIRVRPLEVIGGKVAVAGAEPTHTLALIDTAAIVFHVRPKLPGCRLFPVSGGFRISRKTWLLKLVPAAPKEVESREETE